MLTLEGRQEIALLILSATIKEHSMIDTSLATSVTLTAYAALS